MAHYMEAAKLVGTSGFEFAASAGLLDGSNKTVKGNVAVVKITDSTGAALPDELNIMGVDTKTATALGVTADASSQMAKVNAIVLYFGQAETVAEGIMLHLLCLGGGKVDSTLNALSRQDDCTLTIQVWGCSYDSDGQAFAAIDMTATAKCKATVRHRETHLHGSQKSVGYHIELHCVEDTKVVSVNATATDKNTVQLFNTNATPAS